MSETTETFVAPEKLKTCTAIGKQKATICLPVKIEPFAKTGRPKLKCCGDTVVTSCCKTCKGKPKAFCEFVISQEILVEFPVEFGATINIGETFVDCDCFSASTTNEEDKPICILEDTSQDILQSE